MDVNFSQLDQPTTTSRLAELRQADREQQEADVSSKELPQIADKPQQEEVEQAVAELNEFVTTQSRQLNFSIDEGSKRSVVQVTDSETGELIRQVPSEEVLKLAQRIQDLQSDVGAAVGVLFNKEV